MDKHMETIRHSVEIAKRRLEALNAKPKLTRSEEFEKIMTIECIQRGEALLGRTPTPSVKEDS